MWDDEEELVAEVEPGDGDLSPEEQAMHLEPED